MSAHRELLYGQAVHRMAASLTLLVGCATGSAAGPAPAPAAATRPAPTPTPEPTEVSPAQEPWALEAAPRGAAGGFVEIRFPYAEQRIPAGKAAAYRIRFKREDAAPVGRLVVALDDERPRPVDADSVALAELLPTERELSPGVHWVIAAVVDEHGRRLATDRSASRTTFAAVRFWVESREQREEPPTALYLLAPGGTYNGPAAEVWIDSVLSFARERRLAPDGYRVTIEGEGRTGELALSELTPVRATNLTSGDFRVTVQARFVDGGSVQQQRVITVNRDAPTPGSP